MNRRVSCPFLIVATQSSCSDLERLGKVIYTSHSWQKLISLTLPHVCMYPILLNKDREGRIYLMALRDELNTPNVSVAKIERATLAHRRVCFRSLEFLTSLLWNLAQTVSRPGWGWGVRVIHPPPPSLHHQKTMLGWASICPILVLLILLQASFPPHSSPSNFLSLLHSCISTSSGALQTLYYPSLPPLFLSCALLQLSGKGNDHGKGKVSFRAQEMETPST